VLYQEQKTMVKERSRASIHSRIPQDPSLGPPYSSCQKFCPMVCGCKWWRESSERRFDGLASLAVKRSSRRPTKNEPDKTFGNQYKWFETTVNGYRWYCSVKPMSSLFRENIGLVKVKLPCYSAMQKTTVIESHTMEGIMHVPMSPVRILKRAVKLYPHKTAVVDGDVRFTYLQLQERVNRATHAVWDMGVSPNCRVAILDYNTHRYMEMYFGMAQSGRALLPLNTRLSVDEYIYILNDAEAETLVFHADYKPIIDKVRRAADTVKHYIICDGTADEEWIAGTYEDFLSRASSDPVSYEPPDENDMLNLYYTSGTTGRPKGVILTHRNIYANALTTIISFKLDDTTVWHHIAPLFHLADAFFAWSVTYQGGKHIMQRQFVPKMVLHTIEKEGITSCMMVPTMINFILNEPDIDRYNLASLQWIMVGGAPMSPANAERMMQKLGCQYISGYGLTETSPLLTVGRIKDTLLNEAADVKMGYLTRTGVEVVGVDLRVVDPAGKDVPWDSKTVGEIIARGDNVTKGYWKLPTETSSAFNNGYFYTGDLATVDAEGYILIVDRAKDIIISGGENIASVEIENVIYTHPHVLECAVIAFPDDKWGEIPKVIVALKPGAELTEKELVAYCRERLAPFKVPRLVEFVAELPKTGSGKILKGALRKAFGAGNQASS
jgi:fatty-acyl-CoA synthase